MTTDDTAAATIVAELRRLEAAATPGPWRWNSYSGIAARVPEGHPLEDCDEDDPGDRGAAWICWIDGGPKQKGHGDALRVAEARGNAELIERMRNALPALLDALAAATAERDRLKAALDLYKPPVDPDLWPILALVRLPHERRPMAIFRWPHETLREAVEGFARRWLPVRGYALAWVDPEAERLANEIAADGAADPAQKVPPGRLRMPREGAERAKSADDATGPNSGDLGA